jgi:RNA polymerase sigma factor (sigma-70 family)
MLMTNARIGSALQEVRRLAAAQVPDTTCDRGLLERFVAGRDEAAFEVLVRRHGPMVLSICRRVLRQAEDAEDAFQAAFLVLARSARAVRKADSLPSWLHGVAYRVAANLKRALARRRTHEATAAVHHETAATEEVSWREVRVALDEELARLPDRWRAPLVLCYLQGKTRDEAARELGWSVGTLRGRLERGRNLLRRRLTRRGLSLSAALLGGTPAQGASAGIPAGLVPLTVSSAIASGAGAAIGTARAAALAEGVLRTMFVTRLTRVALVLFTVIALGTAGIALRPMLAGPLAGAERQATTPRGEPPVDKPAAPPQVAAAPVAPREDNKKDIAESEAVRQDGLEFVALIPKRIAVPQGGPRDVALGLRITNVSDKRVTIAVFDVISLWVFNTVDRTRLEPSTRRKDTPRVLPPVTLAAGASWTWQPRATLDRTSDRATLRLSGPDGLGVLGAWSITTLKMGKHRLTIEYANRNAKQGDTPVWVGKATTKEVEFEIVAADREQGKPAEDAAKDDLKTLQGTWRLVAGEQGGKKLPPENLGRNTHWVFSGTTGTYTSGLRVMSGTILLDPTRDPKWIDVVIGKDFVLRGLYELKGDRLRIFLAPNGTDRPTELKTTESTRGSIGTFERDKSGGK